MIFDYAIIGAGASGSLLASSILSHDHFSGCSLLIIDRPGEAYKDRTWCFWSNKPHPLDHLVSHRWSHIYAGDAPHLTYQSIAPYTYQLIKGEDFHNYFRPLIKADKRVQWVEGEALTLTEDEQHVTIKTDKEAFSARRVFDSRFDYTQLTQSKRYPVLQQHFVGLFIQTKTPTFNPDQALFMDFSVPQKSNTRFMYVLPTSADQALVEYTLFSHERLARQDYLNEIESYLANKGITDYEVTQTEEGSIPMSCYPLWQKHSSRIIPIGLAAGWAKPSTGFTFDRTVVRVQRLVRALIKGHSLDSVQQKDRFWFYDLLLLDILDQHNHLGASIFTRLFQRRKPQLILKFLGEKTHFFQELSIMAAIKPWPFLKAFFVRLLKGF